MIAVLFWFPAREQNYKSLLDSVFFGGSRSCSSSPSSRPPMPTRSSARNAGIETVVVRSRPCSERYVVRHDHPQQAQGLWTSSSSSTRVYPASAARRQRTSNKVIAVQPSLIPAFEALRGVAINEQCSPAAGHRGATAPVRGRDRRTLGPVLLTRRRPCLCGQGRRDPPHGGPRSCSPINRKRSSSDRNWRGCKTVGARAQVQSGQSSGGSRGQGPPRNQLSVC